jgi:hypothetical protein
MHFRSALLLFAAVSAALPQPLDPNTLTPQQKAAGWQLLFDGKSLNGWSGADQTSVPHGWIVQDQAIATVSGTAARRDLLSNIPVSPSGFDFQFEFRLSPKANTGVKYFVRHTLRYLGPTIEQDSFGAIGFEFQLMDPTAAAVLPPNGRTGSLYGLLAPQQTPAIPIGQWIPARLTCRASRCEHWLANQLVLSYHLQDPALRAALLTAATNPKQSEISSIAAAVALHPVEPPTYLSLQHHASKVWFRALKLLQFPSQP